MKAKLDMAHEYALHLPPALNDDEVKQVAAVAWKYADAMQAEADKRKEQEQHEANQKVRGIMALPSKESMDDFIKASVGPCLKEDWQPDWSVAPDGYNWWSMDEDEISYWYCVEPCINYETEYVQWDYEGSTCHKIAPSSNYQGDWKDSLRERPTL